MPLGGVASALRPSDFGGSSAVSLNEDEVMEKLRKRAQAHSYTGGGRDWERALRPATKNNSGVFALTNWYSLVRKTFKMTKQDISDELIRSMFKKLVKEGGNDEGKLELATLIKFLSRGVAETNKPRSNSIALLKRELEGMYEERSSVASSKGRPTFSDAFGGGGRDAFADLASEWDQELGPSVLLKDTSASGLACLKAKIEEYDTQIRKLEMENEILERLTDAPDL
eukprot:CAMPEP_0119479346 /NCGR_PEP_ID=MMETSP1344-20130328/8659_1 /TAXON_ID=236787 /ORGANISM="Florenciella parvula, Strain CCMP2471" /LENGTH=226 /DNA_ID=CAMNT_0007513575 /DNA_START=139 /DNA_END=819 /DNA_ORIENTATION=+